MSRLAIVGELFEMILRRKSWVLLPPLLALVFVGAILLLGQATPLGPLIYPLF